MDVNKQAIFGSRPWKIFGEGPASEGAKLSGPGFNEGKAKPFITEDIRFTVGKDGALYAIALSWPTQPLTIKSLGASAGLLDQKIASVELLGSTTALNWKQTDAGLEIASIPSAPAQAPQPRQPSRLRSGKADHSLRAFGAGS